MGPFNNREIATAFWFVLIAVWALKKAEIRKSLAAALAAFFHVKIVASVLLMALYVVGMVVLLAKAGLWDVGLLKDTLVWFFVGAMVMLMRFATAKDTDNILRKITRDAIKIVILLEFLVNTYVFPLAVELVVIPVLTFIAMIDVVAGMNKEHALVAKVTGAIQTVVGFVILGIVLSRAAHDLQNLASLDTAKSIALAPLLSVILFPFIYVALVISQYELVFIRLDFGIDKTPKLRRYARQKIILHAGFSQKRLQYLLNNHMVDVMHVAEESDVDAFLREARLAPAVAGNEVAAE